MLRAVGGAFLYNCLKRTKVVCSVGNRFFANTIILNVLEKRKCKKINFKRFVDQAFLVSAIQSQRLDERFSVRCI